MKTLSENAPHDQPVLYIDHQNILVRGCWRWFGCAFPFALLFLGVALCGLFS